MKRRRRKFLVEPKRDRAWHEARMAEDAEMLRYQKEMAVAAMTHIDRRLEAKHQ